MRSFGISERLGNPKVGDMLLECSDCALTVAQLAMLVTKERQALTLHGFSPF
jgi:hypothetical protein